MSGPWEKFATPVESGPWVQFTPEPTVSDRVADVAKDVVASAGAGAVRGVAELGMSAVTVPQLMRQGTDWLVEQGDSLARRAFGARQLTEAEQKRLRSSETRVDPLGRVLEGGVDAIRKAMDENLYKPRTTAGEYARTAAEFVPGALLPGRTIGNAIRYGIVPGIASEAAGQATKGTAYEPWARAGAGVVAGVGMAATARPSTGQQVLEQAAGAPISRATLEAADALMTDALARGVTLTPIEAINQVTANQFKRLAGMQRIVENSPGGATVMDDFMSARPGQVQRAGATAMDDLAPNPMGPQQIGADVQDAAQGVITDARKLRTRAVEPFYKAAATDVVDPSTMQSVVAKIDDVIASDPTGQLTQAARGIRQQLIETPATPGTPATRAPVVDPRTGNVIRYETTPATPGTAEVLRTNVGELDDIAKASRDNFTFNGPTPIGATATEVNQARLAKDALAPLNDALTSSSRDIARGRELYGVISERINNPIEQGRVGFMSEVNDVTKQRGKLFPAVPEAGSASEVGVAVAQIARKNPKAATDLVGQHARTVFAQATENPASGPNQWSGAKFASDIRGNPEQAASLEAGMRALPGGDAKWTGFSRFLDIMEATGKRLQTGSATAFNETGKETMRNGGFLKALTGFKSELMRRWDQHQLGSNSEAVARLLTDSKATDIFKRLAKEDGLTPQAAVLGARLMGMVANNASAFDRAQARAAAEKAKSQPVR